MRNFLIKRHFANRHSKNKVRKTIIYQIKLGEPVNLLFNLFLHLPPSSAHPRQPPHVNGFAHHRSAHKTLSNRIYLSLLLKQLRHREPTVCDNRVQCLSGQLAVNSQRGAKSTCTREVSLCPAEGAMGPSVAFLINMFPSFLFSLFPLLVRGQLVRLRTYLVHIISPRNYTLKTYLLLMSSENGRQNKRARYAM